MEQYVDLDGVRTWYEASGAGVPLVMLHPGGAGVSARALEVNRVALSELFRTYTPERRGHGRTPDVDGPLTFEAMAQDTVRFLELVVQGPARLLGVSDGAIVALLVALRRPDLVERLVFAAAVFHHDGWWPTAIDPQNEPPAFLQASFAELTPDGADHYPVIVEKVADMHRAEPAIGVEELASIHCRTLVMLGDDDEVRLEHAVAMYRALPDGELAVVPGTSHGLLVEKPALCNAIIGDFLARDPIATYAPIRRASS